MPTEDSHSPVIMRIKVWGRFAAQKYSIKYLTIIERKRHLWMWFNILSPYLFRCISPSAVCALPCDDNDNPCPSTHTCDTQSQVCTSKLGKDCGSGAESDCGCGAYCFDATCHQIETIHHTCTESEPTCGRCFVTLIKYNVIE